MQPISLMFCGYGANEIPTYDLILFLLLHIFDIRSELDCRESKTWPKLVCEGDDATDSMSNCRCHHLLMAHYIAISPYEVECSHLVAAAVAIMVATSTTSTDPSFRRRFHYSHLHYYRLGYCYCYYCHLNHYKYS